MSAHALLVDIGPLALAAAVLVVFVAAVGFAMSDPSASRAPDAGPPNVIVLLVDDWGWTDAGCCGSDLYETPHIDRLAREGMRFTSAYASCTVCSPTRAAWMTVSR